MMNDRQLNIRIPAKLYIALQKEAAKRHTPAAVIVRQALLQELARGGMSDLVRESMQEVMEKALDKVAGKLRKVG